MSTLNAIGLICGCIGLLAAGLIYRRYDDKTMAYAAGIPALGLLAFHVGYWIAS